MCTMDTSHHTTMLGVWCEVYMQLQRVAVKVHVCSAQEACNTPVLIVMKKEW